MNEQLLSKYWNELPTGRENALSYDALCAMWGMAARNVRKILHDLSRYDNGDNYILIRSSSGKGFYKTDNLADIERYRRECMNRGKKTFAPLRKINRVLQPPSGQISFENNLKTYRLASGLKQSEVCERMKAVDPAFDAIMLSKMENSKCFPTPLHLAQLAAIYGCTASDLIAFDLLAEVIKNERERLASGE